MTPTLGQIVRSFFEDYLKVQKGLRPSSIQSYRDTLRLFLRFVVADVRRALTRLAVQDLTLERSLAFLQHLEDVRGNHVRTRNQRLAALRTFFEYVARRIPDVLDLGQRIAAIPIKRVAPPETHYLEREEVAAVFRTLPRQGPHALRDRTLLLFLYNTGARVQEVADLRVANLELGPQPRVQLHGKGDKWRTCPLDRHRKATEPALGGEREGQRARPTGLLLASRGSAHPFRHLQDRPPTYATLGPRRCPPATHYAAHLPAHGCGTPAGIRR